MGRILEPYPFPCAVGTAYDLDGFLESWNNNHIAYLRHALWVGAARFYPYAVPTGQILFVDWGFSWFWNSVSAGTKFRL